MHKCMQSYKERGGKSLRQRGEMVADGRPNGGDENRGRCQRLEDLTGKDEGVLAFADGGWR